MELARNWEVPRFQLASVAFSWQLIDYVVVSIGTDSSSTVLRRPAIFLLLALFPRRTTRNKNRFPTMVIGRDEN